METISENSADWFETKKEINLESQHYFNSNPPSPNISLIFETPRETPLQTPRSSRKISFNRITTGSNFGIGAEVQKLKEIGKSNSRAKLYERKGNYMESLGLMRSHEPKEFKEEKQIYPQQSFKKGGDSMATRDRNSDHEVDLKKKEQKGVLIEDDG